MKSFISNSLLVSMAVFFALAILEVILHIVPLSNDTNPTYKLSHDVLPYTMKPNTESTSLWGHSIKINSHGLRDYEYEYEKSDDTFRILVLGDSSTFAYGNKMEDGFTKVLEKKLNESQNKKYDKIEVINAGHPGYNTRDEYNYYRLYGYKYDPDAVIVAVMTNDFTMDSLKLVIRDGVDSKPGSFWLYIPSWVKKVLRKSHLYVVLGNFIKAKFHIATNDSTKLSGKNLDKKLDRSKADFDSIISLASEDDLPVYFISLPNRYETMAESYFYPEFYDQIANYSKSKNVVFIDVLDHFSRYSERTDEIFAIKDMAHPNTKGHKILANYLYQEIIENRHASLR